MVRAPRRSSIRALAPCVLLVVATGVSAQQAPASESQPVTSRDGMVITTSAPASDVGAAILKKGGNAIDAAVATAFALAVTHPSAGNIGGGAAASWLVRLADGTATTIDYRERCTVPLHEDDVPRFNGARSRASSRPPAISRRAFPARCADWRSLTASSANWRGRTT